MVDEKRMVARRWSEGDKYSEAVRMRKERGKSPQKCPREKACTLMGRERSEYMRWKKERDQIDQERLARHKNAKGEWRRAWDIEKSEHMFDETKDGEVTLDGPLNKKGGKSTRKTQQRPVPFDGKGGGQQHHRSASESASKTSSVMSSKARGKDRLTGRARRWDLKEGEEMPFVKDETDTQKFADNEQMISQALVSETVKEYNCPADLNKSVTLQERRISVSPPKSGASQSTGEEEKRINENTRSSRIQDGSAVRMCETESDCIKLHKKIIQTDLLPKGNCKTNNSCHEENQPGQEAENILKEVKSTVHKDDTPVTAHSERNPSGEDCAEKAQFKKNVGDGVQIQEGEVHPAGLEKQIIPAKEGDVLACLIHREESSSPEKELQDHYNESAKVTKMIDKEQKQSQSCISQEAEN